MTDPGTWPPAERAKSNVVWCAVRPARIAILSPTNSCRRTAWAAFRPATSCGYADERSASRHRPARCAHQHERHLYRAGADCRCRLDGRAEEAHDGVALPRLLRIRLHVASASALPPVWCSQPRAQSEPRHDPAISGQVRSVRKTGPRLATTAYIRRGPCVLAAEQAQGRARESQRPISHRSLKPAWSISMTWWAAARCSRRIFQELAEAAEAMPNAICMTMGCLGRAR